MFSLLCIVVAIGSHPVLVVFPVLTAMYVAIESQKYFPYYAIDIFCLLRYDVVECNFYLDLIDLICVGILNSDV